jgi:hypothetical protein
MGWIGSSRAFTRKKGRANITVDDLVRTITPKGRGMVALSANPSVYLFLNFRLLVSQLFPCLDEQECWNCSSFFWCGTRKMDVNHSALKLYLWTGAAMVPDNVKAELLQRIRSFLLSDALWPWYGLSKGLHNLKWCMFCALQTMALLTLSCLFSYIIFVCLLTCTVLCALILRKETRVLFMQPKTRF